MINPGKLFASRTSHRPNKKNHLGVAMATPDTPDTINHSSSKTSIPQFRARKRLRAVTASPLPQSRAWGNSLSDQGCREKFVTVSTTSHSNIARGQKCFSKLPVPQHAASNRQGPVSRKITIATVARPRGWWYNPQPGSTGPGIWGEIFPS